MQTVQGQADGRVRPMTTETPNQKGDTTNAELDLDHPAYATE
jgi:hypothetical protein